MQYSPESPRSPEVSPTVSRFCGLVEEIMTRYRWAAEEADELEYATSYRVDVRLSGQPAAVRCDVIGTGQTKIYRLVLSEGSDDWFLDYAEGEGIVRSVMKDNEKPAAPMMYIDFDDEELEYFIDRVEYALEQREYDEEAAAIEARMRQDEAAEFEAQVRATLDALPTTDCPLK